MKFEWDTLKARINWRKHKVSFEEAFSVYADHLAITFADLDHSNSEEIFLTFGVTEDGRLLAISHNECASKIRIISARLATRLERKIYEQE